MEVPVLPIVSDFMAQLTELPPSSDKNELEQQLATMMASALPLPSFKHSTSDQASIAYEGN